VTYEGGFKTQLFDRKLSLNGACSIRTIKTSRSNRSGSIALRSSACPCERSQVTDHGLRTRSAVHP